MPSPDNPQRRSKADGARTQGTRRGKDAKSSKQDKSAGMPMGLVAGIGGVVTLVIVGIVVLVMSKPKEPPAVAVAPPGPAAANPAAPAAEPLIAPQPMGEAAAAGQNENAAKAAPAVAPPAPPAGELELLEEWTFEKIPVVTRERKMTNKEQSLLNAASRGVSFDNAGKLIERADVSIKRGILSTSEDQKLIISISGSGDRLSHETGYVRIWQRYSPTTALYIGQLGHFKQPHDGLAFVTHSNGVPRSRGRYTEGKRDGQFVCWDDNGQKRWEGTYLQGVLRDAKAFAAGDAADDPVAILMSLGSPQAGANADPHQRVVQLMAWEAVLSQGSRVLPVLSQIIKQLPSLAAPQFGTDQVDQLVEQTQAVVAIGVCERLADVIRQADRNALPEVSIAEALALTTFTGAYEVLPPDDPRVVSTALLIARRGDAGMAEVVKQLEASVNELAGAVQKPRYGAPPALLSAIAKIGPDAKPAIPQLWEAMKYLYFQNSDKKSREPIWNALAGIGESASPKLIDLINTFDGTFPQKAGEIGGEIPGDKQAPVVDAIRAIGHMNPLPERAEKLLTDIAQNRNQKRKWSPSAQMAAAGALARHDPKVGVTHLVRIIKSQEPAWKGERRLDAIGMDDAIGLLGAVSAQDDRVAPLLRDIMRKGSPEVKLSAALKLAIVSEADLEEAVKVIRTGLTEQFVQPQEMLLTRQPESLLTAVRDMTDLGPKVREALPELTKIRDRLRGELERNLRSPDRQSFLSAIIQAEQEGLAHLDKALIRIGNEAAQ